MTSPFTLMATINVQAGLFSAIAGFKKASAANAPSLHGEQAATSSPWMYVIGGALTAIIGIGSYFELSLATWGTVLFICTSIYDGWFGAGSKDWRFYTLNLYSIFQVTLVVWSTQLKSPFTLP
jgi:hypothetical protein